MKRQPVLAEAKDILKKLDGTPRKIEKRAVECISNLLEIIKKDEEIERNILKAFLRQRKELNNAQDSIVYMFLAATHIADDCLRPDQKAALFNNIKTPTDLFSKEGDF